jgi:hypothetical protein
VVETRLRLERQHALIDWLAPDSSMLPFAQRMLASLEAALRKREHHLAIIEGRGSAVR